MIFKLNRLKPVVLGTRTTQNVVEILSLFGNEDILLYLIF